MTLFNSLGSNFSWSVSLKALFKGNSAKTQTNLTEALNAAYQGQTTLTYKGRQALQLAFESLNLPTNSVVAINGFTCYVVYQAVERAGLKPLMIDITQGDLNFGVAELEKAYKKQAFQVVVVQNTLGVLCDIAGIEKFARTNNLVLIEDLAHSIGSHYPEGREVGMVGDLVMLSFSQDKTLDAVAGGAVIDRRPNSKNVETAKSPGRLKLRFYPMITHLIRSSYRIQIGRLLHKLLRSLGMLAAPMDQTSSTPQNTSMAALADYRWELRTSEYNHRQKISQVYSQNLPDKICFLNGERAVQVRFPVKVKRPAELLEKLKEAGFYFGDTWYDAPLGPKKYLTNTNYQPGDCPEAESIVSSIVNLPTHQETSEADAKKICEVINKWLA